MITASPFNMSLSADVEQGLLVSSSFASHKQVGVSWATQHRSSWELLLL